MMTICLTVMSDACLTGLVAILVRRPLRAARTVRVLSTSEYTLKATCGTAREAETNGPKILEICAPAASRPAMEAAMLNGSIAW